MQHGKSPDHEFAPPPPDVARRQNQDPASNIEWNRTRWGQEGGWLDHDAFGYNWSGGATVHTAGTIAAFIDKYFRPYTMGRYDLDILEISPGVGRVTVELIRYAKSLTVVDLNEVPIEMLRERLRYYPNEVNYIVNDGASLKAAADREYDIVATYDSLVHVHPEIVKGYLEQSIGLLRPGGIAWFDHSGKGASERGRRSDVTAPMVAQWAAELGATVLSQQFRNSWDCISVIQKPEVADVA